MSSINKILNEYFIQVKLQSENSNFTIGIFNINKNIAYTGTFNQSNLTISNTNVAGIYKMIQYAFDNKPGYSINIYASDFNITLNYFSDIFTFSQMIQLSSIDSTNYQFEYNLYLLRVNNEQMQKELNFVKENTVSVEKYSLLVNKYEQVLSQLDTLKTEVEKIQSSLNAKTLPQFVDIKPNSSIPVVAPSPVVVQNPTSVVAPSPTPVVAQTNSHLNNVEKEVNNNKHNNNNNQDYFSIIPIIPLNGMIGNGGMKLIVNNNNIF